jgi:hypothetical protein
MEIALPMPGIIAQIEKRVLSQLAEEAEQWASCLNALSKWEEEHLLDNPPPDLLAQHKQTVEHLIKVGRILQWATEHSDFPDRATAEMVRATQACLEDILFMRHGPRLTPERKEQILAACFPDEP